MKQIDKEIDFTSKCFGCGKENPIGAKLKFYEDSENSIQTTFTAPETWGGWGEIIHGGLQTVLLDEISAWTAISLLSIYGLTVKAEIEFFHPVYVNEKLVIKGKIEEVKGKDIRISSSIMTEDGMICTKGLFTFRTIQKEKIEQLVKKDFSN
ncbi:hypothetical protein ES705_46357 [subsurface metagenome]